MILCSCGAPRWCQCVKRSVLQKPEAEQEEYVYENYCRTTQNCLMDNNPNDQVTTNELCVKSLKRRICCFFDDHPKDETAHIAPLLFPYIEQQVTLSPNHN